MIHAIYRKGVFEPTTPVELPEECEVEFEPVLVQTATLKPTLDDVYAILSERFRSGEQDVMTMYEQPGPPMPAAKRTTPE